MAAKVSSVAGDGGVRYRGDKDTPSIRVSQVKSLLDPVESSLESSDIEQESNISVQTPVSISSISPSSSSTSLSSIKLKVEETNEKKNVSRVPSSASLANTLAATYRSTKESMSNLSLASLSIPSHQRFHSLIHKHEVPRKFLHVIIGFLTLDLYRRGIRLAQVTPVLIAMLVSITSIDFIRFRYPEINKLYVRICGILMREKEIHKYNGVIWYLLGLIIVFLIFPKDICLMSLLLLSWSDTAASTFGRAFGHLTPRMSKNKSLAGSIAAFVCGVFACRLLYGYFIPLCEEYNEPGDIFYSQETSKLNFGVFTFLCGLIGAISEGIDVWDLDDNITIPVISAFFLYGVVWLFHV